MAFGPRQFGLGRALVRPQRDPERSKGPRGSVHTSTLELTSSYAPLTSDSWIEHVKRQEAHGQGDETRPELDRDNI